MKLMNEGFRMKRKSVKHLSQGRRIKCSLTRRMQNLW